MKKNIAISFIIIIGAILLCSCATNSRCPAYGHYSQIEQSAPVGETAL